ncbi:MAG: nucleotidyl transferase AbiEii/AbiGii toxin family protein [Proteobacteria bacterium]|nr:nucleotidyl transferase AbiEii/AbiGii toxin family protein [Pseudomonadota bacterium]
MDLYEELAKLVAKLDETRVEYALCGAMALAVHGVPRATQDIDVLVPPESLDGFRDVARYCGFGFEALPMTFEASGITMHRFSKLIGGQPLMLDALVVAGAVRGVWESRIRVPFESGRLSVVSRPGLITLKLAAGRPQDLADVKRLEELHLG